MTTPAQPDPAAEMRAAAALLRQRAADARRTTPEPDDSVDLPYISLMHPGVGEALAAWLDTAVDYYRPGATHPTHVVRALAVARAILGTDGR